MRPTGAPFLTGMKVTVTSSPGLNVVLLQPSLTMSDGLVVSTAQCTAAPFSSFASNFKKQWGLDQIQSVTTTFKVTFLSVSYAAAPWCANTGAEIARSPRKIISSLFLMKSLQITASTARCFGATQRLGPFQHPFSNWLIYSRILPLSGPRNNEFAAIIE